MNFGVVGSGMFLVTVVFFHSAFVVLDEMGWGLGHWLLLRGGLNLLSGMYSIMLLVGMRLVGSMLLVSLMSLLVSSVVLS